MAQRAVWRSVPDEPQTVFGWTLLGVLQEGPHVLATTVIALIVVAIAALSFEFGGFDIPFWDAWDWPALQRRAKRALSTFAAVPSPLDTYPVSVELFRHGVSTGSDEAIVVFADGWLHIEGLRTMFSLRPCDLLACQANDGRLTLCGGQEIHFRPLEPTGLLRSFEATLLRWQSAGSPDGEPVLPPLHIHPRPQGLAMAGILFGLLLLGGAVALGLGVQSWIALAAAFVIGVCGLWRFVRGAYHTLRLRSLMS